MKNMKRSISILVLLTLLIAAPAITATQAQQQDTAACPALTLQALEATQSLCTDATNNEACYGHVMLDAQPQPNVTNFKFDTAGDIANVADMASLRLSAMDTTQSLWGVALMRLQVNVMGNATREPAMLLLFGDVSITNQANTAPAVTLPATVNTDGRVARLRSTPDGLYLAALDNGATTTATGRSESGLWIRVELDSGRAAWIARELLAADAALDTLAVVEARSALYAPMQAFYMTSGVDDAACPEAPNSGLMIQTPEGVAQLTFLINEVDIQLGSTVFFQAQPGNTMTISVVEGQAAVTANGVTTVATAGSQITVPLDANGVAAGAPSLPRAYDPATVSGLPTSFMDDPVPVADPISDTDLAALLANQPGNDADGDGVQDHKVLVCHNGITLEIDESALDAHLAQGDTEGACDNTTVGDDDDDVTIGDDDGADKVTICHNGRTIDVSQNALQSFLDRGATIGACP
ncbi:MAG: hypothetical protein JXA10_09585 [Anaerolineae bacterium]|nr:hypothetical protein [Anaerolineae bacterium]